MRGNLLRVLPTTLAVLVAGAGTAHGAPVASRYVGYGGPVDSLSCAGSTIGGAVAAAGLLDDVDEATYQGCQYADVSPRLPWTVHATSQSAGLTTYTIDGIEMAISGPGCGGVVGGSADASYDTATGVLTVHCQATVVRFVDPVDNCLGLIQEGRHLPVLSDSYGITTIT